MISKNVEQLSDVCRKAGLKMTHQRLEIFKELEGDTSHPTVEEVYLRVKGRIPTISLDTVYRTMSTFEQHGLVMRVVGAEDPVRFDPDTRPHHHILCERCHRVGDFHWPDFDEGNLPDEVDEWGSIRQRHAVLTGVCKNCLSNTDTAN